jgi:hypothetical protein
VSLAPSPPPDHPALEIEEEEFYRTYKPIKNPRTGDDQWENEDLKNAGIPNDRTWTCVTGDNNSMSLVAGWHWVNRLYYMVTEEPWPTEVAWVSFIDEHDECSECGANGDEEELCPEGHCILDCDCSHFS